MADALRTQFINKLIQKTKFTLAYDALNYPRRPFYTRRVACNRRHGDKFARRFALMHPHGPSAPQFEFNPGGSGS